MHFPPSLSRNCFPADTAGLEASMNPQCSCAVRETRQGEGAAPLSCSLGPSETAMAGFIERDIRDCSALLPVSAADPVKLPSRSGSCVKRNLQFDLQIPFWEFCILDYVSLWAIFSHVGWLPPRAVSQPSCCFLPLKRLTESPSCLVAAVIGRVELHVRVGPCQSLTPENLTSRVLEASVPSHASLTHPRQSKVFSFVAFSELHAANTSDSLAHCRCFAGQQQLQATLVAPVSAHFVVIETPQIPPPPPPLGVCLRTPRVTPLLLSRILQTQAGKHDGQRYPPGQLQAGPL